MSELRQSAASKAEIDSIRRLLYWILGAAVSIGLVVGMGAVTTLLRIERHDERIIANKAAIQENSARSLRVIAIEAKLDVRLDAIDKQLASLRQELERGEHR